MTLFRSFKILIGSSDDIPTTFGTIQTVLPAGKEHFIQITPTLIRNRVQSEPPGDHSCFALQC